MTLDNDHNPIAPHRPSDAPPRHTFGNRDPIGAGECDGFVVAVDPSGSLDAFTIRGASPSGGAIAALCSAAAVPIGDRSDLAALARVRGDTTGPLLAPVLVSLS